MLRSSSPHLPVFAWHATPVSFNSTYLETFTRADVATVFSLCTPPSLYSVFQSRGQQSDSMSDSELSTTASGDASQTPNAEYDPTCALLINDLSHLALDDPVHIYLRTLSRTQEDLKTTKGHAKVLEPLLRNIAEKQPWETPIPNPTADAIRSYARRALDGPETDAHPTDKFIELLRPISLALQAKLPLKHKLQLFPTYNAFYNIARAATRERADSLDIRNDRITPQIQPESSLAEYSVVRYPDIPSTALEDLLGLPAKDPVRLCLTSLSPTVHPDDIIKLMQFIAGNRPPGRLNNPTVELVRFYARQSLANPDGLPPATRFTQELTDLALSISNQRSKASDFNLRRPDEVIAALMGLAFHAHGCNIEYLKPKAEHLPARTYGNHDQSDAEDNSETPQSCAFCGAEDGQLLLCAACNDPFNLTSTSYCNVKCQTAHWAKHKSSCRKAHGERTVRRAAFMLQSLYYTIRRRCHEFVHCNVEEVEGILQSVVTQPQPLNNIASFPFVRFDHNSADPKEDQEALLSNLNSFCPRRHMFPLMLLFLGGKLYPIRIARSRYPVH